MRRTYTKHTNMEFDREREDERRYGRWRTINDIYIEEDGYTTNPDTGYDYHTDTFNPQRLIHNDQLIRALTRSRLLGNSHR